MRLRPAAPGDVPDLARIMVAARVAGFGSFLGAEELAERDEAHFAARFAEEWPHMRLVEDVTGILGFCEVRGTHLDLLFVDPPAIGRGVGRRLLDDAVARGAASLECFRDNVRARAFYEREGWHVTAEYRRDFGGRPRDFVRYERQAPAQSSSGMP